MLFPGATGRRGGAVGRDSPIYARNAAPLARSKRRRCRPARAALSRKENSMRRSSPIAVAALRGLCYMTGDLWETAAIRRSE